ncbi:MAG TPA: tetratricopeptide repeat protein [Syntrophales bacterium]|nr:tetratricopeptide repeat protein [Syntrophales bacterium]HOL58620.1 tetratricopeptide repeat protein [Syntrophales bacterium]HPO35092.1 tetratricopeptide repeat protein [Syntrophales bacterium]
MKLRGKKTLLACLTIAFFILLIYWQVQGFKFVFYDDNSYITERPLVLAGLTWEGVKWAFRATEAGFWHPLTWLSLMVDSELFRLNTGGYHWTNVILHIISSLLFFLFLYKATKRETLSFLCALLFAVHPLHVESVAWVSQRKDLLSTLFGFASLLAYAYYAQKPRLATYLLVLTLFLLALMSKPMVVTFPVLMFILDFWPFGRFSTTSLKRLIGEKIPFLSFAFFASLLVIYTERKVGALSSMADLGLGLRISNAIVSYAKYVFLTFYPKGLAFFYPYPESIPLWKVISALLFLLAITAFVILFVKKSPYLAAGWFWYLVTLLPVCGLIQVGPHAMADRYSYVTINGLFIMAVWGTAELTPTPLRKCIFGTVWLAALLALSWAAWVQTGYWRNTKTLMERALQVTTNNWIAYTNLGVFHTSEGRYDEGIECLEKALKLKPQYSIIHYNMGYALNAKGEHKKALPHLKNALKMGFKPESTLLQIGFAYEKLGNWLDALETYRKILEQEKDSVVGRSALAFALEVTGKTVEAEKEWKEVLTLSPGDVYARKRLLYIYLTHRNCKAAIGVGEEGVKKEAVDYELYRMLSLAYRACGDLPRAEHYLKLSEPSSPVTAPKKPMGKQDHTHYRIGGLRFKM